MVANSRLRPSRLRSFALVIVGAALCAGRSLGNGASTLAGGSGVPAALGAERREASSVGTAVAPSLVGTFLGARVNPAPACGAVQYNCFVTDLHAFEAGIGRTLAMYNSYFAWTYVKFPTAVESDNVANHRYTILAINCGDTDANVAAGNDDATIISWAQAIKAFGQPVMMRWFWEMNLDDSADSSFGSRTLCFSPTSDGTASPENANTPGLVPANYFSPQEYVAAWQHIHDVFVAQGVTNVSWLWNVSGGGLNAGAPIANYYPGDNYVDWIGFDMYDRTDTIPTAGSLSKTLMPIYRAVQAVTTAAKPMMVPETGSTAANQQAYLTGVDQTLSTSFPQIHAFEYFDVSGSIDWSLGAPGLAAFNTLSKAAYFAAPGP